MGRVPDGDSHHPLRSHPLAALSRPYGGRATASLFIINLPALRGLFVLEVYVNIFQHPMFKQRVSKNETEETADLIVKLMQRDANSFGDSGFRVVRKLVEYNKNHYLETDQRQWCYGVLLKLRHKTIDLGSSFWPRLRGMGLAYMAVEHGSFSLRGTNSLEKLRLYMEALSQCDDFDDIEEYLRDELDIVICDHCDQWEFSDYTSQTRGGSDVCRWCVEESYRWSDYYDQYIDRSQSVSALDESGNEVLVDRDDDDFRYNDEVDRWTHVDYEVPEPEVIASYHSSKREQRVQPDDWTRQHSRYLGVELEVEVQESRNRGDCAKSLNDVINDGEVGRKVFFESDGSLNNGFEIITQPISLPAHRELWKWLQNKSLVKGLKSHQTTTCGLHVHVSRSSLSALQIGKIVAFVNAPENESLMTAIARRYGQAATGYCRIKDKSKIGKAHKSEDRYEAVNVTPRNTIEFRIFKGSLKYESVISAVEFTNAMVEFTKPYSGYGCNDMKSDCFLEFINKKMPQETQTLRSYIQNRLEIA